MNLHLTNTSEIRHEIQIGLQRVQVAGTCSTTRILDRLNRTHAKFVKRDQEQDINPRWKPLLRYSSERTHTHTHTHTTSPSETDRRKTRTTAGALTCLGSVRRVWTVLDHYSLPPSLRIYPFFLCLSLLLSLWINLPRSLDKIRTGERKSRWPHRCDGSVRTQIYSSSNPPGDSGFRLYAHSGSSPFWIGSTRALSTSNWHCIKSTLDQVNHALQVESADPVHSGLWSDSELEMSLFHPLSTKFPRLSIIDLSVTRPVNNLKLQSPDLPITRLCVSHPFQHPVRH